ncbi:unnamed protein product [Mytilus coruscus]|uniref:Uncharacterized protein n=1 Tax=Mytilus coruscus TaxID=42192 RepID=A0A6J8EYA1_MYTCO|nr:unnamed protein product [Mytilus coruscus]
MVGDIDMQGHSITNLPLSITANEPVTKGWYAKNWQDLVKNFTDRNEEWNSEIKLKLEFGPIKPKSRLLCQKCKFEWDPVEQRSICLKCGLVITHMIDRGGGDFDAWNSGRLYGKVQRFSQLQCPTKTIRNHQCTHPCRLGKDLCLRHFNLAIKKGTIVDTVDTPRDWESRLNLPPGAWERFS